MKLKLAVAAVLVLLIVFAANWKYQSVYRTMWNDQREAIRQAVGNSDLTKANQVRAFNGEQSAMIVFGTSEDGRKMIIWVRKDEIHAEYADEGTTEAQIKSLVAAEHPDASILRVIPGVWEDEYVWEVFYKTKQDDAWRHYYEYYRFSDAARTATYRLAVN